MSELITRQEYFAKLDSCNDDWECREKKHRQYYAQFVSSSIRTAVLQRFGIERLSKAFQEDKHLNNIPLKHWDNLGVNVIRFLDKDLIRNAGEVISLSSLVCILKEAGRQLIDEYQTK